MLFYNSTSLSVEHSWLLLKFNRCTISASFMSRTPYKALAMTEMNDGIQLPLYLSSHPGIAKKKVLKSDN